MKRVLDLYGHQLTVSKNAWEAVGVWIKAKFTAVERAELFLENMNPNVLNAETVGTSDR